MEAFLKLLHDHKDELLVLVSLTAVCVSFLAAIVGPAVQWRIACLNVSANVLSANRIRWIEALQSDIATYTVLVERTEFLTKSMDDLKATFSPLNQQQSDEFNRMFKEYEEKTLERNKLGNLIGIKLNVSSEKRHSLFEALEAFARLTPGIRTGDPTQVDALANVQKITRDILDEEWSRIEHKIGRGRRAG
jgi:hypothetical protein